MEITVSEYDQPEMKRARLIEEIKILNWKEQILKEICEHMIHCSSCEDETLKHHPPSLLSSPTAFSETPGDMQSLRKNFIPNLKRAKTEGGIITREPKCPSTANCLPSFHKSRHAVRRYNSDTLSKSHGHNNTQEFKQNDFLIFHPSVLVSLSSEDKYMSINPPNAIFCKQQSNRGNEIENVMTLGPYHALQNNADTGTSNVTDGDSCILNNNGQPLLDYSISQVAELSVQTEYIEEDHEAVSLALSSDLEDRQVNSTMPEKIFTSFTDAAFADLIPFEEQQLAEDIHSFCFETYGMPNLPEDPSDVAQHFMHKHHEDKTYNEMCHSSYQPSSHLHANSQHFLTANDHNMKDKSSSSFQSIERGVKRRRILKQEVYLKPRGTTSDLAMKEVETNTTNKSDVVNVTVALQTLVIDD